MAYCAVGSMSSADWAEIKKLCSKMRKEFDQKLDTLEAQLESEIAALDAGKIQTILNQINALNIQMQALITGQEIQDQKILELQEHCANLEITVSEVIEAYNG